MKNTLIIIVVIGLLVFGFIFLKEKQKANLVQNNPWPETVPANTTRPKPVAPPTNPTNNSPVTSSVNSGSQPSTNNTSSQNTAPVNNESGYINGELVFNKSNGNPSTNSTVRHVSIASKIMYETSNPICGYGNDFVSTCSIFTEDNLGNINKVAEWPNQSVFINNKTAFNSFEDSSGNTYYSYNDYAKGTLSLDGDLVFFDSNTIADCGGIDKINHWSFNLQTKKFTLISQTPGSAKADDCD